MIAAALLLAGAAFAAEPYPEVRADRRVELLGMVRLLAHDERSSFGFYRRDLPYERELEKRLGPLAAHPVVARWQELERGGLGYVAAYQWILTLGEPPELNGAAPTEDLEEFRLMLADFARASRFDAVWKETEALRAPMLDDVRAQAADGALRSQLERYWRGKVPVRYSLIVSEFVEPAIAVTALTADEDGTPRLTSVTGAEEFEGKVRPRLKARQGTIWAEALNEALKPAFDGQAERLKRSGALFATTGGRCAATWSECARKEAAFAAATRMLALAGDKASADEWPVKYARVGMPHLAPLVERLKEFEGRRGTLADFVPRLLDAYEHLGSTGTPFASGIGAALTDPSPCVLILPDIPSDRVARFAREKRLCDEELTGAQASARDLSGRSIVSVGPNAWLAKNWDALQLPAHLEGRRIRMNPRPGEAKGTVYEATGFASVARNPQDAARPVLLFTGAEMLEGFPENADYEIRDGSTTVKAGIYEKSRLPWRLK